MQFPDVTRVEVIGPDGRIYSCYGSAELVLQDDERTLKLFVTPFDPDQERRFVAQHETELGKSLRGDHRLDRTDPSPEK